MWIQNRNILEIADVPNTCLCFSCFHMLAYTRMYYSTSSYPPHITKSTVHNTTYENEKCEETRTMNADI